MSKIDFTKDKIPFTQVANSVLQDKNLSASAKGLYAYLYSKPEGWEFNYLRIATEFKDSKNTILKHIHELEKNGLLTRKRLATGRVIYNIHFPPIEPLTTLRAEEEKPLTKKASDQNSHRPKIGHISNKDNTSNKDIYNNKDNTAKTSFADVPLIIKEFESINPAVKRMYGNKTQRQACEDLINTYGLDRILSIISKTLPKTNQIQYFPVIVTPLQLRDKFSALESAIQKFKNERTEKESKHKVAFY